MLTIGHGGSLADVRLSANGRWLSFRRRNEVLAVDTRTGRVTHIGRLPEGTVVDWLDDGRIVFAARPDELDAFTLDGHRTVLVRRLPIDADTAPTVSPDGRHVLYARGCSTWLLDVHGNMRQRIRNGDAYLAFAPGAWSPDSRHYFLREGEWFSHCTRFSGTPSGTTSIRSLDDNELGLVGGEPTWSSDGSLVVSVDGLTGTAVGYLQPLAVFDLRARQSTALIRKRVAGVAYAGPGGWTLFSLYDRQLPLDEATADSAGLYLARISDR
jgi:hypothetical protein